MRVNTRKSWSSLVVFPLLLAALAFSAGLLAWAQDTSSPTDPLSKAFAVAREVIEDKIGKRLNLNRWYFYEDNWSSVGSLNQYGGFGIDNCTDRVPMPEKRGDVIFGWTFTLRDRSGKEYQARVSYDLQSTAICDEVLVPARYGGGAQPTATPTPVPGADPQAAPAAPAPSTADTGGFNLGGQIAGLGFDNGTANVMRSAGMNWVKVQVRHGINNGIGAISDAKARGFNILVSAIGQKSKLAANFDAHVAEFADYVAWHARSGANAIEVWNEPNIDHEWPAGQINGGSYTRLLAAAYNAIKGADPGVLVVSAGPSPTGWFGAAGCGHTGCNDDHFMRQMAAADAAKYMDCVGIHYNAGAVPPTATSGAPVAGYHYSWYLPSMMQTYRSAFPAKPLCFTELGYLTGDGFGALPGAFAWASGTTLQQHAEWLGGAARYARSSGYVRLMIVWNVNNKTFGGADPQAGYAIIRPGGGCPACGHLRAAMGG